MLLYASEVTECTQNKTKRNSHNLALLHQGWENIPYNNSIWPVKNKLKNAFAKVKIEYKKGEKLETI